MESKELIQALREDAEWAHANEWETPITLGDHLDAAADALEALLSVTAERDALKERTRADVAPVVHGEWVEAKLNGMSLYPVGQKMCSVCGQIMPSRWKTMPPFCYGCGCKMDAKSEAGR